MKSFKYCMSNFALKSARIYPNIHISKLSTKSVQETLKKRTDFEELFLNKNVRCLLKRLTGYDPTIVFASKSLSNLESPKYRFMTSAQLDQERKAADERAKKLLQMPPVKYSKAFEPKVFEKDEALKGFMKNKLIFVDASPGVSDQERLIVVREIDGTLREATREERHRMNQAFYPIEERQMDIPKMLESENMEKVMERKAYKLLLENACLHFEPDDERYLEIVNKIYEDIRKNDAYDTLYSTRFFGGMVYYYVYFRRADNFLLYLLENDKLDDAYQLIKLYYIVNPREGAPIDTIEEKEIPLHIIARISKNNKLIIPIEDFIGILKFYTDNDATDSQIKGKLQLAAQKIESESLKAEAQN